MKGSSQAGQAVFFDFDESGPGYLAYDLAVFLWNCVLFERKDHAYWHAFVEGYRTIREISHADFEAVHLFVPIRHMWLLGSTPVASTNGVDKPSPRIGSLQSWISCSCGSGRSCYRGCSNQTLHARSKDILSRSVSRLVALRDEISLSPACRL